jgi:hypothetical protein
VLSGRSLPQADHTSGEVLPTVVRRCVRSRNLVIEEVLVRGGGGVAPKNNQTFNEDECMSTGQPWPSLQFQLALNIQTGSTTQLLFEHHST